MIHKGIDYVEAGGLVLLLTMVAAVGFNYPTRARESTWSKTQEQFFSSHVISSLTNELSRSPWRRDAGVVGRGFGYPLKVTQLTFPFFASLGNWR